ncbi:MAG: CDP-diacylglycerol--glycerol-3-phosphate 3-phosphatidyltransferase [Firmicutes bacterium]|nr:CDP-diacylglycerol--glycerol-3-phosphate 3-phosphatidyltransferase [Bacillota bacterium]
MNLPNKLTTLRVLLIPVFLVILMNPMGMEEKMSCMLSTLIFCLASVTDWFDGYLARKMDLVTTFGKFMDPLADKLLVCSAMIALCDKKLLPAIVVIIIIAREFFITGFRTIAAEKKIIMSASIWGKLKTTSQMIMIIILLLNIDTPFFKAIGNIFIWLSLLLTIVSAFDYVSKNIDVLRDKP